MGRNGESKLPGFQKYEEHEKRGLGALTIELGKLENPSHGFPHANFGLHMEKMTILCYFSHFISFNIQMTKMPLLLNFQKNSIHVQFLSTNFKMVLLPFKDL